MADNEHVIDFLTGLALDIPLEQQGIQGWWERRPEVIERIHRLREEHGIVVEDNFPRGKGKRTNLEKIREVHEQAEEDIAEFERFLDGRGK